MSDKRIALLIDTENTSYTYIDSILKEINEYGTVTYKRMYGNFTDESLKKWNEIAVKHGIVQIHQPRYSSAKNATDIMLVIDAMDILYGGKVEGFCIVSSDSDFTRLVNRLRESGMDVIGMGKGDASKALKAACTSYKNIEILVDDDNNEDDRALEGDSNKVKKSDITPLEEIISFIEDTISKKENLGKDTGLGEIGSQLIKAYSDFDVRNYGYKSLTTFVEDLNEFEVTKVDSTTYVSKRSNTVDKKDIEQYITQMVAEKPMALDALGSKLHDRFVGFKVKDYGYAKLESFVKSIAELSIEKSKNGNGKKMVSKKWKNVL